MGKGIILGIDFSIDFTQMAVLDDEINPRSISIGTEDNFLIPSVVCYNSELNEWSAGDEAVNKSRLNNSTEYRKLPEILKQNYGEDLTKQIITTYMSYLLKVAVNYSNGKLIKNVLVTLNEVTPEMIEEIKPHTVMNAIGAESIIPLIPGVDKAFVKDSHDVLDGKAEATGNVVVIGGGMVGMETAEYLAEKGAKVSVLEMLPDICSDMGTTRKICMGEEIQKSGIIPVTSIKVTEIGDNVVIGEKDGSGMQQWQDVLLMQPEKQWMQHLHLTVKMCTEMYQNRKNLFS